MDIAATARPEFRVVPIRFISALPIAFAVTLALLYLMHRLVYIETPIIDETPTGPIVDVVHIPTVIKNRYETTKPEQPNEPQIEPLQPELQPETFEKPTFTTGNSIKYNPGTEGKPTIGLGTNDSVVQQVMVPPQYPRGPLAKGIEGYVDIAFEVSVLGTTKNVRVIGSEPEGVFERSALRAVKRWKYLPRDAEAAQPITVHERIRFKISGQ